MLVFYFLYFHLITPCKFQLEMMIRQTELVQTAVQLFLSGFYIIFTLQAFILKILYTFLYVMSKRKTSIFTLPPFLIVGNQRRSVLTNQAFDIIIMFNKQNTFLISKLSPYCMHFFQMK